ncbi:MAG: hypothetical protein DRO01_03655, partial [Thermoproteota archaeon]
SLEFFPASTTRRASPLTGFTTTNPLEPLTSAVSNSPRSSLAPISAASGVFGLGVGLVLYYTAMEVLGVGLSSLASSITPLVSQVAGRLVSGEPLSARILAGGALISLGLALVALQLT